MWMHAEAHGLALAMTALRPKFGHWDFPRVRVKADLQQRSGKEFL